MFQADEDEAALRPGAQRFAAAEGFEDVHDIVLGRCSMCHSGEPSWEGLLWPPKGIRLETEAQIAQSARAIYMQAGLSHAMPPANLSFMEEDERAKIVAWYRDGVGQ